MLPHVVPSGLCFFVSSADLTPPLRKSTTNDPASSPEAIEHWWVVHWLSIFDTIYVLCGSGSHARFSLPEADVGMEQWHWGRCSAPWRADWAPSTKHTCRGPFDGKWGKWKESNQDRLGCINMNWIILNWTELRSIQLNYNEFNVLKWINSNWKLLNVKKLLIKIELKLKWIEFI